MSLKNLALATLAIAAGAAVVIVGREVNVTTMDAVLGVVIGWSFIASGLIARKLRPENKLGAVMVLTGFLQMGAEFCVDGKTWVPLGDTAVLGPLLYSLGHLLHLAFILGVGWILLAFPAGRLDRRGWHIFGLALFLVPLRLSWLLLGGDGGWPDSFALTHASGVAVPVGHAESVLGLILAALVVMALVHRWRHASQHYRFALAPVLWAGAAGFAVLGLYEINQQVRTPFDMPPLVLLDGVLAAIPVGFLVGLLRARLAHSAVAELVVELGDTGGPATVRDALARALHDPSLTLVYWITDSERYIDVEGHAVMLPADDEERAVTVVERDGIRIGALIHDPGLSENPRLIQSVCAAAALTLQNERLQAELRAHVDDLQASRVRIVEAADEERRRIERNLHDGTQQRLVSISMALGLAQAKLSGDPATANAIFGEARQGLSQALEELRELSRGIHPGILTERGLGAALDELALRAALPVQVDYEAKEPLSEQVEATAYYVVSEALANIAKYAQASNALVRVESVDGKLAVEVLDDGVGGADATRGSGLRGLSDRAEALGGRLWLSSPAGKGTVLRAELPCG